jgi:hypothetical protein
LVLERFDALSACGDCPLFNGAACIRRVDRLSDRFTAAVLASSDAGTRELILCPLCCPLIAADRRVFVES